MSYPFQVTFDCHHIEAMAQAGGRRLARAHAGRCVAAGAALVTVFDGEDGWHIAMLDPEGNEFGIQ